ncbi:MAG: hypothetical protein RL380_431 [Verrucomicrobiota bacterium]|jgi:hypothetical protein
MKIKFLSALALLTLALVGCDDGPKKPYKSSTESGGNPVTAPVDYLGAVANAKHYAEKKIDVAQIQKAVQFFHEAEDRYPKDLNELVEKHYLGEVPKAPYGMKINYDASTGEAQVVKQ